MPTPTHVNIESELQDWENAVFGRQVRSANVSALRKLQNQTNNAIDFVVEKGQAIDDTIQTVENVRQEAVQAVSIAQGHATNASGSATESANSAQSSANSAIVSESWAIGGTGIRPGEGGNNSKYYANQAESQADRAQEEADRAASYSTIVAPTFRINWDTMELIQESQGTGVTFTLDENKILSFEFV